MREKHQRGQDDAVIAGEAVVLVHGLWFPAAAMSLLARRLRRRGWRPRLFAYSSRRATPRQNAAALAEFVRDIDTPRLHFVAHSLGGLVVMQLLQDFPGLRGGRVVLLGTPYHGSYVARRLRRHAWGRWLCGLSLERGLLGDGPRWPGGGGLGVIAGRLALGAGWIVPGLAKPNDGTVAVAETRVAEADDSIVLPVSHSGLLFSAAVARQVARFLARGCFGH